MQAGSLSEMQGMVDGSNRSWKRCPCTGGGEWHSFIHPHSSSPSLLLLFATLKLDGGGMVGHNVIQYSERRGIVGSATCHSC